MPALDKGALDRARDLAAHAPTLSAERLARIVAILAGGAR